jgi:SAM-dependent methyltransferase
MNVLHRWCCNSSVWATLAERQMVPWTLNDEALGTDTLEIGPGYGANLRVLAQRTNLTAVEIDPALADGLQNRYGDRAEIIHGDGTDTGLADARFDSVVCFTMLHHVPTPALQDKLFAEACRVVKPGGVFVGSDGVDSIPFALMHIGDTYNPAPTETLAERLRTAGFGEVSVDRRWPEQRWRAVKP